MGVIDLPTVNEIEFPFFGIARSIGSEISTNAPDFLTQV
ncbi:MAG: hypothetical protein CM1200mP18_18280 [Gammaproteobacteria bacterium]|nr:MAG: hypothetical protein CM1200mP18_18280 [Gammaproteobacteria bacterium]